MRPVLLLGALLAAAALAVLSRPAPWTLREGRARLTVGRWLSRRGHHYLAEWAHPAFAPAAMVAKPTLVRYSGADSDGEPLPPDPYLARLA